MNSKNITRKNHSYRIVGNSLEDIIKFFSLATTNPDRKYMKNEIMPHLTYLEMRGIKNISEITQFLHDIGFKAPDMNEFIYRCVDHIYNDKEKNIQLFTTRQQEKSNASEKNIVLNRIALQFPDKIIQFFESYIDGKFTHELNRDAYVNDFKLIVQQLENQCELNKVSEIDSFNTGNTSIWDQQENQSDLDYDFSNFPYGDCF